MGDPQRAGLDRGRPGRGVGGVVDHRARARLRDRARPPDHRVAGLQLGLAARRHGDRDRGGAGRERERGRERRVSPSALAAGDRQGVEVVEIAIESHVAGDHETHTRVAGGHPLRDPTTDVDREGRGRGRGCELADDVGRGANARHEVLADRRSHRRAADLADVGRGRPGDPCDRAARRLPPGGVRDSVHVADDAGRRGVGRGGIEGCDAECGIRHERGIELSGLLLYLLIELVQSGTLFSQIALSQHSWSH